jgi:hypothetical protein
MATVRMRRPPCPPGRPGPIFPLVAGWSPHRVRPARFAVGRRRPEAITQSRFPFNVDRSETARSSLACSQVIKSPAGALLANVGDVGQAGRLLPSDHVVPPGLPDHPGTRNHFPIDSVCLEKWIMSHYLKLQLRRARDAAAAFGRAVQSPG